MGYLQDFERELEERLGEVLNDYAAGESTQPRTTELVRWVKEQLLASYRNGQAAGLPRQAGPSRPVGQAPSRNGTNARPERPARKAGQYRR